MKEGTYKGLLSIILTNEQLKVEILPNYGAKMASLYHKTTGREFLFQSSAEKLDLPDYGASFSDFDSSGFDEMFPSIDSSFYPTGNWKGTAIPDHGEVWTLPWDYKVEEEQLSFSTYSRRFPYKLTKKIKLEGNKIRIDYKAFNFGREEFKFIWAAHALLNANPDTTRLILPPETEEVVNVEPANEDLGNWGERHPYPITTKQDGSKLDLSKVEPPTAENCQKFYISNQLKTGRCGVEYTATKERLIYRFPTSQVPYLGVWKSQGGYRGDYNIALEPCTGIYDDLYLADAIEKAASIAPNEVYSWYLELEVENY